MPLPGQPDGDRVVGEASAGEVEDADAHPCPMGRVAGPVHATASPPAAPPRRTGPTVAASCDPRPETASSTGRRRRALRLASLVAASAQGAGSLPAGATASP